MVSRFAGWYEEHTLPGDAVLAAVLLLVFALPADLSADTGPAGDLAFSAALIACVPFRRVAPVAVFGAVSAICLVQLALLDHIVAGDVVALIALYTVVAYGPGALVGAVATACMVAGAVLAAVRWDAQSEQASTLDVGFSTVASTLLAAVLGAWQRSRRDQLAALEERGAALERARIARELHDIVAHSLSVMVVQADGAAAGAEQRPAAAAAALRTIADTGRDALGQMRRLLGVLREERDAEMAPQPGAAQLDALVAAHGACPPRCRSRACRGHSSPRPTSRSTAWRRRRSPTCSSTPARCGASTSRSATTTTPSSSSCATTARARTRPGTAAVRGWSACASGSRSTTARSTPGRARAADSRCGR